MCSFGVVRENTVLKECSDILGSVKGSGVGHVIVWTNRMGLFGEDSLSLAGFLGERESMRK